MTPESFLALLDGVKQTRRGSIAKCPAHPDKSPSLSVSEAQDGRILVKCWAGCTAEAIVEALGLELKDLFPESNVSRKELDRARRDRDAKQAAKERQRQREGVRIDRLREAEHFVRSARNIPDFHTWSDEKLHRILSQLDDAHAILREEEVPHE